MPIYSIARFAVHPDRHGDAERAMHDLASSLRIIAR
jgi:hypothetical protein